MGVKGLSKLIKDSIKTGNLSFYKNKRLGIDTSLYMHKFGNVIYCASGDDKLCDKIISSFKNFNTKLKKNNVTPTFVFDTKSNDLKKDLIEQRQKNTKVKVVQSHFYKDLKDFFSKEEIDYCSAPSMWEAEQYGAFLTKADKIDAFVTADLDSLAFGAKEVVTKIGRDNGIEYYILSDVLNFLEISHEKFVLMCIMMGTDFSCKGVKNYGPKKSHKYVKEHTVQQIKDFLTENLEDFDKIYEIFNQTLT